MQEKLDEAYNQIKEMATKTVEVTGGVKILGNNGSDTKAQFKYIIFFFWPFVMLLIDNKWK